MNSTIPSQPEQGGVRLLVTTVVIVLLVISARAIWGHVNDPLNRFPGPPLAAWSHLPYTYWLFTQRVPFKLIQLHQKYGPVVRIAPNELSFNTAASYQDIYGYRQGQHQTFIKSKFYEAGTFSPQAHSIIAERDPIRHARQKKLVSAAFSDKALKSQEGLINDVVDNFIKKIGVQGSGEQGTNLVLWFSLITFDIIGSLSFGESFGGVESGEYHPWLVLLQKCIGNFAFADASNRFPFLPKTVKLLFPKYVDELVKDVKSLRTHVLSLVGRRLDNPIDRPDFLNEIRKAEAGEESEGKSTKIQLAAHAVDFIIAGSETTATTLSSIVYHILRDPVILRKLQAEIHNAFESYDDITIASASHLKYFHAVALEAMRLYPPVPTSAPRIVPAGGDTVDGHFVPAGVIVATQPFVTSLSPTNYDSPMEFRPERWLGSNKSDKLEAFQPFSLGTRACLGRSLAWVEINLIISKLIFSYDLEFLNKDQVDYQRDSLVNILWQKPGLLIRLSPRVGL